MSFAWMLIIGNHGRYSHLRISQEIFERVEFLWRLKFGDWKPSRLSQIQPSGSISKLTLAMFFGVPIEKWWVQANLGELHAWSSVYSTVCVQYMCSVQCAHCVQCKALKKPAEQNQMSTLPMKILHSRTFWRWSKASFDKKKSSAEPNGNSHSQNFSWDLGSFFLARSGDIIFNFSIMSRNMRLKDWKLKRLLSHWALLLLTQASELNLAVWCYTLECATS